MPSAATSFVGHGEELRRLAADLPLRRLITLTGVGGVGKTRLALEAGGMVADEFPDGVWLCELAPVAEPAAVAHAVATTLSIRTQAGLSLVDSVVDALRGRRLLVILDNCEHLLDAAAELVGRVTESCPTVTVLATSREPLGVAGERVWVVPSLSAATEGVRLFCDRAEAAHASFSPSEGDLAVIAEICERLDGIPLAIELAAARVRFMTAADLAERLHDRFRLLRGGRRGLERHHTLAATVQWSYRLLAEAERVLFDRLSVFAGGFTLAAAEAVCADDRVDRLDVAGDLAALVDKSMVVADRAGNHARYRLLETLRQFGEERLDETAQAGELRDRHLRYYVGVAHEARRHYEGRAQAAGAATFRSEWANIRAAIQWAITQDDRATATGLLDALFLFAYLEERYELGDWASQALTGAARDADRVRHRRGVRRNARRLRPRAQPDRNGARRGEITNRAGDMGVLDERRGAHWYLGRREEAWGAASSRDRMTDPTPHMSTLAGAIRIVRMHGFARQVPLILAMMVTGFLEGVGVASLFPILSILTEGQTALRRPHQSGYRAGPGRLACAGRPLGPLCLLVGVTIWLKAAINLIVARSLGRVGATIGQDIREPAAAGPGQRQMVILHHPTGWPVRGRGNH